ncbi:ankyrin, partial [Gymnopus androsaceus JB14]
MHQFNAEFLLLEDDTVYNYPLAAYAARYWPAHVRAVDEQQSEECLHRLLKDILIDGSIQFVNWAHIHEYFEISGQGQAGYTANDLLHFATKNLSSSKWDIGSPLYYAALSGWVTLVKFILESEANPNTNGGYYGNALQAAVHTGNMEIVNILLQKKVNVNQRNQRGETALQEAVIRGHDAVATLLLEAGADVSA